MDVGAWQVEHLCLPRFGLVLLWLCCHRPCMCHARVLKQEMVAESNSVLQACVVWQCAVCCAFARDAVRVCEAVYALLGVATSKY